MPVADRVRMGGSVPRSITYLDTDSVTDNDVFSKTMQFGEAHARRYIFVVLTCGDSGDDAFPSGVAVTIGGVTATQGVFVSSGAGTVWIGGALVPSGTSGTVQATVTYSATMNAIKVSTYRVTGLGSLTPAATATGTGTGSDDASIASILTPNPGFTLIGMVDDGANDAAGTITNATTDNTGISGAHGHDTVAGAKGYSGAADNDCAAAAAYAFS